MKEKFASSSTPRNVGTCKIPIRMVRANSSPALSVKPTTGKFPKDEPKTFHTVEFPSLYIRQKSIGPKKIVGERERVVGEKISRKTEEWLNEETGTIEIRTVETVEKIIEFEVLFNF